MSTPIIVPGWTGTFARVSLLRCAFLEVVILHVPHRESGLSTRAWTSFHMSSLWASNKLLMDLCPKRRWRRLRGTCRFWMALFSVVLVVLVVGSVRSFVLEPSLGPSLVLDFDQPSAKSGSGRLSVGTVGHVAFSLQSVVCSGVCGLSTWFAKRTFDVFIVGWVFGTFPYGFERWKLLIGATTRGCVGSAWRILKTSLLGHSSKPDLGFSLYFFGIETNVGSDALSSGWSLKVM